MRKSVFFATCIGLSALALGSHHSALALTVEEMVQSLAPKAQTRSLSPSGSGAQTRNLMPVLDLTVNFDFDSAKLRDDSKGLLVNLSSALTDPRLATFRFQVEGHTDAKGTAQYNDQLSARRAQSVVNFLSEKGVEASKLQPVGKGFKELLIPAEPLASQNRRVRVITLGQP